MSDTILIENGTIIDGTGKSPFKGSVLVADGMISSVGVDAASDPRAASARRLDATGQTVMPGLIDAHCHLAFDDASSNAEIFHQRRNALSALVASYNAKKLLRAGVTGLLDPDSTFENMIDLRDAIEAGVVDGPRMSCGAYALVTGLGGTAGRLVNDTGTTGYYMSVNGRDEIVGEVRRQIKYGADWIKVHVTGIIPRKAHLGEMCIWTLDELKIICDTAHELETPVMGHCRGNEATLRAAAAGFDLIFHATGMGDDALKEVIDRKIPIAPALTFQANMVDFGERLGTADYLIKLFESEITDSIETMTVAHKEGVPLLTGSEAGFSMVPYGDWHYREMEVFSRYFGLSALEAISCATRNGAMALKMEGQVGTIAPGFQADIICVEGAVEKDLTILGDQNRIKTVMIAGQEKDLSPLPPRKPIPGWRLASMGKTLSRDFVDQPGDTEEPLIVEELH